MLRRRAKPPRLPSAISGVTPMKRLKSRKRITRFPEDDLKDATEQIQKITDKAIEKIDKAVENKTKEILTV